MNRTIEEILDDCIIALDEGEDFDTCLSRYPEHVDELKPLLKTALKLQSLSEPVPNQQHLNELLIQIGSSKKMNNGAGNFKYWFASVQPSLFRVVAIFLAFVIISTTAVSLSANSLPGTLLYPIKLFTEKVQFFLIRNSEGKAELRITFSEKRIEELVATNNRDNSLDRELLNATLDEAKKALDRISELPEKQQPITLLAKLDRLNAYQKDVLEQIEVSTPEDDNVIQEAIDLCRDRGQWMRQYRTTPASENKRNLQQDKNSPWCDQCRW